MRRVLGFLLSLNTFQDCFLAPSLLKLCVRSPPLASFFGTTGNLAGSHTGLEEAVLRVICHDAFPISLLQENILLRFRQNIDSTITFDTL